MSSFYCTFYLGGLTFSVSFVLFVCLFLVSDVSGAKATKKNPDTWRTGAFLANIPGCPLFRHQHGHFLRTQSKF